MAIETVKMSSKGQIVIPQHIRERIKAVEGSVFAVVDNKDSVILKKIETPTREDLIKELKKIAVESRKSLEKKGVKEEDIQKIVEKTRRN